jgi:hypothetical protein
VKAKSLSRIRIARQAAALSVKFHRLFALRAAAVSQRFSQNLEESQKMHYQTFQSLTSRKWQPSD